MDSQLLTFAFGALAGLGAFTGWLVKAYIADLSKQRDAAIVVAAKQTDVTAALTDAINKQGDRIDHAVATLEKLAKP